MRRTAFCILACCCSVAACGSSSDEPASHPQNSSASVADNIVALKGGATMIAAKGSVGRDMVDWVNATGSDTRHFELGGHDFVGKSIELTAQSQARLHRLVALLGAHPEVKAKVIGYTDSTGEAAENARISEARAKQVVDYLVKDGVSRSTLTFEGRGDADPIGDNKTQEGRALNQRVALILTKRA